MTQVEIKIDPEKEFDLFEPLKAIFRGLDREQRIEKAIYLWMKHFPHEVDPYILMMDEYRTLHKRSVHGRLAIKETDKGEGTHLWLAEIPVHLNSYMCLAFDPNWSRDKGIREVFLNRFKVGDLNSVHKK